MPGPVGRAATLERPAVRCQSLPSQIGLVIATALPGSALWLIFWVEKAPPIVGSVYES